MTSIPTATVVDSTSGGVPLVSEETLERAKRTADDELAKRRRELVKANERELAELRKRLEGEVKNVESTLKQVERVERESKQTEYATAKLLKDALHSSTISQVEHRERTEIADSKARIQAAWEREDRQHRAWVAAHPDMESLFIEREIMLRRQKREVQEMRERLEKERQLLADELRDDLHALEHDLSGSSRKHTSNLIFGTLLGGLMGYIIDRARM